MIPDDAVQRGPNGLYAFVVGDDNKVGVQDIKVSQSGDGESVVEQGLTPGQRVVVAGQYRLQVGSVVQPTEAPPSSAPGQRGRQFAAQGARDHEWRHFRLVHPASDRDLAVDGRHPVRRHRRLPEAAGRAAAAGRLSHHPGLRAACPAPAPTPWPRRWRSRSRRQFAQIPGVAQMTSTSALGSTAITVQFDLDRNIDAAANDVQAAINAASGQLPKNLPTPPTYRKVNPADSPILLLGATSDTLPLTDGRRQRRDQARPADQPDLRRRPGHHRRPAEAGDPHPARSRQAGGQGPVARGCAHPARRSRPWTIRRARIDGPTRSLHHLHQRPADRSPRTGTTSSSPIATARRCACATSARP